MNSAGEAVNGDTSASTLEPKSFQSVKPVLPSMNQQPSRPIQNGAASCSSPTSNSLGVKMEPRTGNDSGYSGLSQTNRGSGYPSTISVNPTVVLLQHNRNVGEQQRQRAHCLAEPAWPEAEQRESTAASQPPESTASSTDQKTYLNVARSSSASDVGPNDEATIPLYGRSRGERSKDWYKTMFKQIHKVNKETPDENPYAPTYRFPSQCTPAVVPPEVNPYKATYAFPDISEPPQEPETNPYTPTYVFSDVLARLCSKDDDAEDGSTRCTRSTSSATFLSSGFDSAAPPEATSGRSSTLPARISIRTATQRSERQPIVNRSETRQYRAEPRSIFEYEPGKSSVLEQDHCAEDTPVFDDPPSRPLARKQPEPAGRVGLAWANRRNAEAHDVGSHNVEAGCVPRDGSSNIVNGSNIARMRKESNGSMEELNAQTQEWFKFFSEIENGRDTTSMLETRR
uniref:sorbin and SH3 domain-containing protein 1-like n=1 Tax=Myxine glutinosa TaxID=7769 RepID=UPI00358F6F3E